MFGRGSLGIKVGVGRKPLDPCVPCDRNIASPYCDMIRDTGYALAASISTPVQRRRHARHFVRLQRAEPEICTHSRTQDALNMLQTGGTLLFAYGLVHLNPWWLNQLLREVLDHRLGHVNEAEWLHHEMDVYCSRFSLHIDELRDAQRRFLETGRLSKEYLRFLWQDVRGLEQGELVFDRVIHTMSTYGALFPYRSNEEEATEFVVPARAPFSVADENLSELERAITCGVGVEFSFVILTKYLPPGIIAQFVGWFSRGNNITLRACWENGASFTTGEMEHLFCLHKPIATLPGRIQITVAGKDKLTVWVPALRAKDALVQFLHRHLRGLRFIPPGAPVVKGGNAAWQQTLEKLQDHLQSRKD